MLRGVFLQLRGAGLLPGVVHGLLTGAASPVEGRRSRMLGLSCGTRASVLRCRQDLPGPGTKLTSPALAGGLLTPGSPGKPFSLVLMVDASTWSIRVFQVSICHHVNHEICSLSSKEKQRTMFAGHSGQHPPFHFINIFLPCCMETNRCILTPENKVLPYGIQSSEGK